jgi:para-nitrobenzyl esterase
VRQYFAVFLCGAFAAMLSLSAAISRPVVTDSGPVSGMPSDDGAVTSYKGIPYAAPPIGDLRWRAPKPPATWNKVRKSTEFSASCIQNIVAERKPWTYEFMAHNQISEDCLYLNIWAPVKSAVSKLPVYFWIHGGGFVEGSSAVPAYEGENLARRGVVVVSINYRLGVLGFLAHPELTKEAGRSGNYGLLDQLAALRWVHKNIAAFGGNPGNVTISGQSAGAGSVHSLVASPLAKGLFQRAIAESGSAYATPGASKTMADAEMDGVKFASAKGAANLRELRAMSPAELMAKISDGPASAFRPVIDGYFLTADPVETYIAGKQVDVPELTGMNMDERSYAADYGSIPMADYVKSMRERFGDLAVTFLLLYPNSTQEQSGDSQKAAARDAGLVSMFMWSQLREKTSKTNAYTYYWTHAEPGPDSARYGAFHTSEVPYVFNTLEPTWRPWTDQDRKISQIMESYWINFMQSGNPNGPGLADWPAFSAKTSMIMELGDNPAARPVADTAKMEFWETYFLRPGTVSQ